MSDFANIQEFRSAFTEAELDDGVDFVATGDNGFLVIPGSGFGEDGFGEGPFGGEDLIVHGITTPWTNINTP